MSNGRTPDRTAADRTAADRTAADGTARDRMATDGTSPGPDESEELDEIDAMLVRWAEEIPGLDPLIEGIVERIEFLAGDFRQSLQETLAAFDLDRRAFSVIGRLRSVGAPYRRTPGDLARELRLSSGAMTARLDRLEEAGFIRRLPDPGDRRGTLVEPTDLGLARWDHAVGAQAQREALLASVLDVEEREALHRLLRRLMRAFPPKSARHGTRTADPAGSAADGHPEPDGGGDGDGRIA